MRGGYRAGAGRKRGFAAKNAEEARKLLSERVTQEIGPISEALISQAKKGDIRAIKELFDRAWGRAPQATAEELSQEGMSIVVIRERDSSLPQYKNSLQISEEVAIRNGLVPSEPAPSSRS